MCPTQTTHLNQVTQTVISGPITPVLGKGGATASESSAGEELKDPRVQRSKMPIYSFSYERGRDAQKSELKEGATEQANNSAGRAKLNSKDAEIGVPMKFDTKVLSKKGRLAKGSTFARNQQNVIDETKLAILNFSERKRSNSKTMQRTSGTGFQRGQSEHIHDFALFSKATLADEKRNTVEEFEGNNFFGSKEQRKMSIRHALEG